MPDKDKEKQAEEQTKKPHFCGLCGVIYAGLHLRAGFPF